MKVGYSYLLEQFNVGDTEVKVKYMDLPKQAHAEDMLNAEFESKFAKLCQTKYAVGLSSGTDALFLSMKVLDIGLGDEVITAPSSFIATAASIAIAGAKPVFVDVNDEYNINPDLIEASITPKTKAIIPVHLTGNPADMPRILEIASKYKLYIIEDAAQAISAHIDGKAAGSFGIAGCFSLHPLKNLNVWGDGGVLTTNSKELYEKSLLLRNHGLKNRDECVMFAFNSRLDTLQAIVAIRLMDDLEDITNTRIKHARIYDKALSEINEINLPPRKENVKQVFHTYVIQAKDRNALYKHLLDNGVEAKVHYPNPLHLQEAAKYLGYKEGDFPVCEAQAKSILTLPVHQHLTEAQLVYVIDTIKKFYGSKPA